MSIVDTMQAKKNHDTEKCDISATELFLGLAEENIREEYKKVLGNAEAKGDWAVLQQRFLQMIDDYIDKEMEKTVESNIDKHEAGGQWRIAFPHQAVRGNSKVLECMKTHMEARRKWVKENLYHGFPNCCEVHHEIETFIYFQLPLVYWKLPGAETALESIIDTAHHIGNWEVNVPKWYDWKNHCFLSSWLGTKEIRNYPPYDYQEANHFRFTDVGVAAYLFTGEKRYLDLACDYADMWCNHIEKSAENGEPINCSIVPKDAEVVEMGHAGARKDSDKKYMVFYSTVADNTVYDIAGNLLDLYKITENKRYLTAAELLMDQLFQNGSGGRPAIAFSNGQWRVNKPIEGKDINIYGTFISECTLLARLALRHDMITETRRYREFILKWASQINEESNLCDQMMSNLMVAAHFYDGNPQWLVRAYAMALRTAAVVEKNDEFHQCNWAGSRQGTKFLMELLYQPLLGGVEWGTRGNIPILCFTHRTEEGKGLPKEVSFRIWSIDSKTFGFEAINLSSRSKEWYIEIADDSSAGICIMTQQGDTILNNKIMIDGGGKLTGRILKL